MNSDPSITDRITSIVGEHNAERIISILDEEAATPCRDVDCMRRRPHSRLSPHLWRHAPNPPLTRSLFGWRCFTCGKATWRRIHKPSTAEARR